MPVQPVSKNHWSLHQLNSPDPTAIVVKARPFLWPLPAASRFLPWELRSPDCFVQTGAETRGVKTVWSDFSILDAWSMRVALTFLKVWPDYSSTSSPNLIMVRKLYTMLSAYVF